MTRLIRIYNLLFIYYRLLPDSGSFVLDGEYSGTGTEILRAKAFCFGNYLPSYETRDIFYFSIIYSSDYNFYNDSSIFFHFHSIPNTEIESFCKENLILCIIVPLSCVLVVIILSIWGISWFILSKRKQTDDFDDYEIEMDTFNDCTEPEEWFDRFIQNSENQINQQTIFPNKPLPPAPNSPKLPPTPPNIFVPID